MPRTPYAHDVPCTFAEMFAHVDFYAYAMPRRCAHFRVATRWRRAFYCFAHASSAAFLLTARCRHEYACRQRFPLRYRRRAMLMPAVTHGFPGVAADARDAFRAATLSLFCLPRAFD